MQCDLYVCAEGGKEGEARRRALEVGCHHRHRPSCLMRLVFRIGAGSASTLPCTREAWSRTAYRSPSLSPPSIFSRPMGRRTWCTST